MNRPTLAEAGIDKTRQAGAEALGNSLRGLSLARYLPAPDAANALGEFGSGGKRASSANGRHKRKNPPLI